MGTLFIVATPIGNLEDITLRAIKILSTVDIIACEDTRRTGNLLKALNVTNNPKLISYYEQNELQRIPEIINLLKDGSDVALVSDAGTPTISDPGFKLVRECIGEGIKVESIPGPSSILAALTISGLPTDKFLFLGYLPEKPGRRIKILEGVKLYHLEGGLRWHLTFTIIVFVAPHKLTRILEEMKEVFGDIDIVICRELTKIHEEVRREKISQSIAHFSEVNPKGEFVILLNHAR